MSSVKKLCLVQINNLKNIGLVLSWCFYKVRRQKLLQKKLKLLKKKVEKKTSLMKPVFKWKLGAGEIKTQILQKVQLSFSVTLPDEECFWLVSSQWFELDTENDRNIILM